ERTRVLHRVELVLRQRGAGLKVTREAREHLRPPDEVLEELARQLDGVPRDAIDARERRIVDLGQQVVQRMAELMEQRDGLRMREQRRRLADRRVEVADDIRDRRLEPASEVRARDATVDPGAAALVRPRVEVRVEAADERAVAP